MADLIDRQAAIDALEEYADRLQMVDWKENPGVPYKAYALNWCINTIRDLPSAQPERKTGRWEYVDYGGFGNWHCTACRNICICNGDYDFCPNCGADMRKPTQVQLDEADDVMMGGENGKTD